MDHYTGLTTELSICLYAVLFWFGFLLNFMLLANAPSSWPAEARSLCAKLTRLSPSHSPQDLLLPEVTPHPHPTPHTLLAAGIRQRGSGYLQAELTAQHKLELCFPVKLRELLGTPMDGTGVDLLLLPASGP